MSDGKKNPTDSNKARAINEFQPDAIEIENERLPWWIRFSVLFLFAFMAVLVAWTIFCRVDVVVEAPGRLVTDEPVIVMKPLESSVIKKVHVKIGEIVKKDQVLITFDTTRNLADGERLLAELNIISAQYQRLLAEFEGKVYEPAKDSGTDGLRQKALFLQRSEYFRERCNFYDERVKELESSRKAGEETLANQQRRLEVIRSIEKMHDDLYQSKAGSLKELLSVNISRMEMENAVDEQRNRILELTHQRESQLSAKKSFIQEWKNNISEELVKVERELIASQKAYDKVRQLIACSELRAPCDSVVHDIASFPVGSAVQAAEALITLVPLVGDIELEAELPPQNIGKVRLGSPVRIKLNAWPFQKYGTMEGSVRNISENTFSRQGMVPITYYRVRISVSGSIDHAGPGFRLIPGMEAQAEILTGKRRIIEYLLHPLIKALDETAREP